MTIALFVLEPVRAGVVSTLVDGEIWLLLALHQSTTTMGAIEGSVLVAGRGGALDFIAGVAKRAPPLGATPGAGVAVPALPTNPGGGGANWRC